MTDLIDTLIDNPKTAWWPLTAEEGKKLAARPNAKKEMDTLVKARVKMIENRMRERKTKEAERQMKAEMMQQFRR